MKKVLFALLLTIGVFPAASAADRPSLPAGFQWQEIPEVHAIFLKPNGWFFHQERNNGTLAYFISKEDISNGGSFQTGLTINVFANIKDGSSVEKGKTLVDNIVAKHPGVNHWTRQTGPFKVFGCLITDTDTSGSSTVMTYVLANEKTNTLYVLIFESPESSWNTNSDIVKQMMSTMSLDASL